MAAELINLATSDKLKEMDWMKNIEICEIVSRDPGQAKDVVKAIKKRLGHKSSNTQLFAVLLLEMLMNNCGEHIHKQVIDTGILPILVKIVKKKTDLPVREKIFLLLDAMQTSHGGASGQFPQYYAAYYELVSAGVKFTQAPRLLPSDIPTSEGHENNRPNHRPVSPKQEGVAKQSDAETIPESSIIQKAASTLEVLREVLDAVDSQHCEGAKDEFTLDLVEQCTFQKQRVMHLVLTSQDEKVVSRAIELNEQMHKLLSRHDTLLSSLDTSLATHLVHEAIEEEDDDEGLFRRIRKGKACMRPEEEEHMKQPAGAIHESVQAERLHRPLIRPLCLESQEPSPPPPPLGATVIIPPPPAKHVEREKFFQEKRVDGQTLSGHMRGLSLHSRNASSSYSESVDSNE